MTESQAANVAAAVRGDRAALDALLAAIWPDAYRIAWSILRERTAAEDAAQDACARVAVTIATLRNPERFTIWLYRIVVNEARGQLRRAKRDAELVPEPVPSGTPFPDDRIDLVRAIGELDPAHRLAVVFHYYYGFSSSQVAAVTGVSPVTVRWQLMVARRTMRARLAVTATSNPQHLSGELADER